MPSRYVAVPRDVLAQVDAVFGEAWSSELAAGSAWVAHDDAGFLGVAGFDARGLTYRWLRDRPAHAGVFGPFGFMKRAHPDLLVAFLHGSLFALRERGYTHALIPAVGDPHQVAFFEREAGARTSAIVPPVERRFKTVVLASGNGSNFEAVLAGVRSGELPLDLSALVVNRPGAGAIERACLAGLPVRVLEWQRGGETRAGYDRRLLTAVEAEAPDLVLLLGWMHVLADDFLERFPQTINVHPAFLPLDPASDSVMFPDGSTAPAQRGVRAVEAALSAGARWVGATAHLASPAIDRGAVLARAPLAVLPGEQVSGLLERLHRVEHRVVNAAIRRWVNETA